MAQIYGPMQYRPNPSGMTLNSRPPQFQMPAPVTPASTQPSIMNFNDWLAANPMGSPRIYHGDRGSRTNNNGPYGPAGIAQNRAIDAYNRYRLDAMTGQTSPGLGSGMQIPFRGGGGMQQASAPVQGVLGLDPTAAAYAKFMNGAM